MKLSNELKTTEINIHIAHMNYKHIISFDKDFVLYVVICLSISNRVQSCDDRRMSLTSTNQTDKT
jgi:hypothetical protein